VGALGLCFSKVAQDLFDAVLVLDGLVEAEFDLGHTPEPNAAADLSPKEGGGALECSLGVTPCRRLAERGVEDVRHLKVSRHFHARQCNEADAGVMDLAASQHLAQLLADLVSNAIRTEALRHN
jgi:hypothetical protein